MNRQRKIECAKALRDGGWKLAAIAEHLGIDGCTVKRWTDEEARLRYNAKKLARDKTPESKVKRTAWRMTVRGMMITKLTHSRSTAKRLGFEPCSATLDVLIASYTGQCEICGDGGKLCLDHDHTTGRFRGWLCSWCNSALGHARDNPDTLRKLAEYLER